MFVIIQKIHLFSFVSLKDFKVHTTIDKALWYCGSAILPYRFLFCSINGTKKMKVLSSLNKQINRILPSVTFRRLRGLLKIVPGGPQAVLDISFEVKKCLCYLVINYWHNVTHHLEESMKLTVYKEARSTHFTTASKVLRWRVTTSRNSFGLSWSPLKFTGTGKFLRITYTIDLVCFWEIYVAETRKEF